MAAPNAVIPQKRSYDDVEDEMEKESEDSFDMLKDTILVEDNEREDEEDDLPAVPSAIIRPLNGSQMVEQLKTEAQRCLSTAQYKSLETFLSTLREPPHRFEAANVEADLKGRYARFLVREPQLCNKPAKDLVSWSGKPDALVALVMHYPTFVKSNDQFLDSYNPCVRMFIRKGFTNANANDLFGFDIHWRKEKNMGGNCPACVYPKELLEAHDSLSEHVLQRMLSRMVVLVGKCVRLRFLRLNPNVVTLRLPGSGADVQVYLDFKDGAVHRMAVSVHHPMYFFYGQNAANASRTDCALNLIMHLAQWPHNQSYFSYFNSQMPERNEKMGDSYDPIQLIHDIKREEELNGIKAPKDFPPWLLSWAFHYHPSLRSLIQEWRERGLSVAWLLADSIQTDRIKKLNKHLDPPLFLKRTKKQCHNHWHGKQVTVSNREVWLRWGNAEVAERYRLCVGTFFEGRYRDESLTIHFDSAGISIKAGLKEVWRRPLEFVRWAKAGVALEAKVMEEVRKQEQDEAEERKEEEEWLEQVRQNDLEAARDWRHGRWSNGYVEFLEGAYEKFMGQKVRFTNKTETEVYRTC